MMIFDADSAGTYPPAMAQKKRRWIKNKTARTHVRTISNSRMFQQFVFM